MEQKYNKFLKGWGILDIDGQAWIQAHSGSNGVHAHIDLHRLGWEHINLHRLGWEHRFLVLWLQSNWVTFQLLYTQDSRDTVRMYAWVPRGSRSRDPTPFPPGNRLSTIAAMTTEGHALPSLACLKEQWTARSSLTLCVMSWWVICSSTCWLLFQIHLCSFFSVCLFCVCFHWSFKCYARTHAR